MMTYLTFAFLIVVGLEIPLGYLQQRSEQPVECSAFRTPAGQGRRNALVGRAHKHRRYWEVYRTASRNELVGEGGGRPELFDGVGDDGIDQFGARREIVEDAGDLTGRQHAGIGVALHQACLQHHRRVGRHHHL